MKRGKFIAVGKKRLRSEREKMAMDDTAAMGHCTEHSVEIVFDPRFLCRPFGIVCQRCGKVGAGASREEAERVGQAHELATIQDL
jgi:hypothetical protein